MSELEIYYIKCYNLLNTENKYYIDCQLKRAELHKNNLTTYHLTNSSLKKGIILMEKLLSSQRICIKSLRRERKIDNIIW